MRKATPLFLMLLLAVPCLAKRNQFAVGATPPPDQSDGPSYSDTVKWVQENIKSAGVPVRSMTQTGETFVCTARKSDGTCANGYNDANGYTVTQLSGNGSRYSVEADGCNSLTIINSQGITEITTDAGAGSDPQRESSEDSTRWKLPFASIDHVMISPQKIKLPDLCDESHPIGSPAPPPCDPGYGWEVYIVMKDESGSWYGRHTFGGDPTWAPITAQNFPIPDSTLPGIGILFGMPGTEDVAPHMVKALQHLMEICKEHPEQAPKPMF